MTEPSAPDLSNLRTEIIESQKAQTEFMRWKLLAAGAVGYLTLTHYGNRPVVPDDYLPWLLALVPLICLYCDLVCTHLQLRIHVIGSYLRQLAAANGSWASYEQFVDRLRVHRGRDDPFAVETVALYGSTFLLSGAAAVAAVPRVTAGQLWPGIAAPLIILMVLLVVPVLYRWRRHLLGIVTTRLGDLELPRHPQTRAVMAVVIQRLTESGTFDWSPFPSGLFPATQGDPGATNYDKVWIRDNVHIAHALLETGDARRAVRCGEALIRWTCGQEDRFHAVIEAAAAGSAAVPPADPMDRPHIRFDGRTLTPVAAGWPHAQNDAWGYLLWFVARLLRREHVLLTDDTLKALSLIVDYLGAIRYWEDEDNGHWEETAKIEASSIGTVVAGLRELQALLDRKPEHAARFEMLPRSITSERLGKLQAEGWEALDGLLPKESERRPYDAALLFLIYPLRLLDGKRARKICRRTRRHLSGSHGICRYRGDTFWSPDYDALPAHLRTAPQQERIAYFESMGLDPLRNGGEAQWCLFDPILSIIHADRALTARTAWGRWWNTRRHQRHLERALEQLARASESWQTLRCPELFYRKDGGWVPNDIQGLNWTAANLRLALQHALRLRK